jgi:outer membrane immunogenic protein
MIRSFLMAGVSSIVLATTALAADLPSRAAPPIYAPPPPVFNWSGFYIGINGGYGGDRFRLPFSIGATTGNASITSGGFVGGGQVGFNYQWPTTNFLIGFEADIDATSIRGAIGVNATSPFGFTSSASIGSRITYIGTARGRIGWAWDRFFVFGTGGFAYGGTRPFVNFSTSTPAGIVTGVNISQNFSRTGFAAGGGFEYALTPNWTFRTEYLFVSLGTSQVRNAFFGTTPLAFNPRTTANIVRAALNYKFDWYVPPAPVVAKY